MNAPRKGRRRRLGWIATAIVLAIVLALIAVAIVRVFSVDEARTLDSRPHDVPWLDPTAPASMVDHETPNPVDPRPERAERRRDR